MFSRFETDVVAFEEGSTEDVGVTQSGKLSLGKYEALGSNRGMLWAEAITEIVRRPLLEIMVGNYSFSVGAHSDYIDVLARNSVIGLIMFIALLIGLAFKTYGYARTASPGHNRVLHFLAFTLVLCFILYAAPFRLLSYTTTAWYMWTMLAFSLAWSARRVRVTAANAGPQAEEADPDEPEPDLTAASQTWPRP